MCFRPLGCWFLVCCGWATSFADQPSAHDFFEARIRPVLIQHCYECHSQDAKQVGGSLLLDSRAGLRAGGDSGEAVVPEDPAESLLLQAIRYESMEMPPSGKLPPDVIRDFERWIREGAIDPREELPPDSATSPRGIDLDRGREFWAFQAPRRYPLPSVAQSNWPRRPIDAFVLAQLEKRGLAPTTTAERVTLIRRVSFDLTGLPPTPELVDWFVAATSPTAYEELVEKLLASPQFGERWARLWLDVARYAEDQAHIVGNNDSLFYPNAYLYREWLIQAFNHDIAYDQFVRYQLAADLLPSATPHIVALGFLGLGPKYYRRNAPEVMADEWEDRVDTVTRGLLGLTVACARCHDHKFDPIPTEDYYALAGVFASTEMFNRPLDPTQDADKPTKRAADAIHVVRDGQPKDIAVHIRGDALNPGDSVPRHFLSVLSEQEFSLQEGSGRRQLAEAIASPENPLTARVIVNRVWAQYFGKGLVATPSNFGQLGGRPTHPRLLDDLAVRFVESGWSLKWLHREIVCSATYRQSSQGSVDGLRQDPANEWLSRMPRRRLSVEMWRDAMLAATGELNDDIGGTSLEISDPQQNRRSVYGHVSRLKLNAMQQMFDFPDPNVHAAGRTETTTPLQKLFVLNSQFMCQRAERFVERLGTDLPDAAPMSRIQRAYALALSRTPTEAETSLALDYLVSDNHWQQFAQILFASNEMIHVD